MAMLYGQTGSYVTAMDPASKQGDSALFANTYLGATTSMEPGKAMKDLLSLPASGIENVEISVIDPQKFEAIPREMFSEARRLGKMLIRDFEKDGRPTPISMHAPLVEPTGFSENRYDESAWKSAQHQLAEVVDKAALLGPSVPLNIHGSHVPSVQTRYDPKDAKQYLQQIYDYAKKAYPGHEAEYLKEEEKTIQLLKNNEIPQMMTAVEPVSGQLLPLQAEVREPAPGYKHFMSPQERLEEYNRTQWDEMKRRLLDYFAEIQRTQQLIQQPGLPAEQEGVLRDRMATYATDFVSAAATTFDHANRADPDAFSADMKKAVTQGYNQLRTARTAEDQMQGAARIANVLGQARPKLFQPVEDFARKKASETFANVAMRSYEIASKPTEELRKAGIKGFEQAPIITIENVSPEAAFGRGDSLKALITDSRAKFAEKLVTEKKIPQDKANEIAGKLIGATWDVGHINLMRRYGYDEKRIVEELKNLAQDVKHVHLTDNFGSFDAHLAPGMGNVPIKDFLKILEKEGKLKDIRGIVEAGGYVMNYGENPTPQTLRYFNVPMYGRGAPSWGGESPVLGGYFMGSGGYSAGYGLTLPPIHYSEYGAGFTGLPTALGAVPGAAAQKSAFAGAPNA